MLFVEKKTGRQRLRMRHGEESHCGGGHSGQEIVTHNRAETVDRRWRNRGWAQWGGILAKVYPLRENAFMCMHSTTPSEYIVVVSVVRRSVFHSAGQQKQAIVTPNVARSTLAAQRWYFSSSAEQVKVLTAASASLIRKCYLAVDLQTLAKNTMKSYQQNCAFVNQKYDNIIYCKYRM